MKIAAGFAGAALAGGLLLSGAASAQDAYATTDLNMRAGPGPQFPVVGGITADGTVDIIGCTQSGNWCDVSYDGERGWAYAPYLAYAVGSERVVVPEVGTRVEVPTAEFEVGTYWDNYYRDRTFYEQRATYVTGAPTATSGAITGAVIGGPAGPVPPALVPPERVTTYVTAQTAPPVLLDGEVVIGAGLPEPVVLDTIPDYEYRLAVINGQRVLVDPGTRRVVYVYR